MSKFRYMHQQVAAETDCSAIERVTMAGDFPDIPFIQAAGDGGPRSTTQMVVIHATDNTASDEAEASYATHRPDRTSAHFYSDEDSVIQGVQLSHVAYGCYPIGNSRSVQFELSGLSNHLTDATLRRIAPIVRRVCDKYGIPIRHVGPAEIRAGAKGICGHGDVTLAWGQGTHTDPGATFPWSTFIDYVTGVTPQPQLEDDVKFYRILGGEVGVSNGPVRWGFGTPADVDISLAAHGQTWADIQTITPADLAGSGWGVNLNALVATVAAIAAKVDISPAELEQIKQAAGAGVAAAVPAIVDALVAKLPADTLSRQDIEAAVRDAFAGGLAPDTTP